MQCMQFNITWTPPTATAAAATKSVMKILGKFIDHAAGVLCNVQKKAEINWSIVLCRFPWNHNEFTIIGFIFSRQSSLMTHHRFTEGWMRLLFIAFNFDYQKKIIQFQIFCKWFLDRFSAHISLSNCIFPFIHHGMWDTIAVKW